MTATELKIQADQEEQLSNLSTKLTALHNAELQKYVAQIFIDFDTYYTNAGFQIIATETASTAIYKTVKITLTKQATDKPYYHMGVMYRLDLKLTNGKMTTLNLLVNPITTITSFPSSDYATKLKELQAEIAESADIKFDISVKADFKSPIQKYTNIVDILEQYQS
ncbi:MAG: hypothetical protein FWG64_13045 [Firmicutes bacterium]|nr:hypothetical protein [Bacillota bacterium]